MANYRKNKQEYMMDNVLPKANAPQRKQEKTLPQKKRKQKILPNHKVSLVPVTHVLLTGIACVFVFCSAAIYLHANSSVQLLNKSLSSEQTKLSALVQDNEDLENEITNLMDLDTIRKKATEDLGMVAAKKSQIIIYDKSESEYVRQNENIPKE